MSINLINKGLTNDYGSRARRYLTLSEDGRFLFAGDPGSSEISVLAIQGEKLVPVSRVPSGGVRPISVTVRNNRLYVVNHDDATIAGFTVTTGSCPSWRAPPRS